MFIKVRVFSAHLLLCMCVCKRIRNLQLYRVQTVINIGLLFNDTPLIILTLPFGYI